MTEALQLEDIAGLCKNVPRWLCEDRLIDPDINPLDKNVTYEGRLPDGRVIVINNSACEGTWTDYSVAVYDRSPHEGQAEELTRLRASDNKLTRVRSENFDSLRQLYEQVSKTYYRL